MEHGPAFYLLSWSVALILTLVALSLVTRIPFLRRRCERHEAGRSHSLPRFYRLGGVVLAVTFLLLLTGDGRLEWSPPFLSLYIGSLAIIIFSLADDFEYVAWQWHLALQLLLGILVYASGMRFDIDTYLGSLGSIPMLPLLGVLLWIVLIMNAVNWADGTDGLMPGIAFCAFGTLFVLALRPEVNQPTVAILAVSLMGLSIALLLFNWYPAKIVAGTGGAYFLGFTLAVLALYAGMKVATLLLVLVIPVCDALFVLVRRILAGHSPFVASQEHFHHLLLAHGWSPPRVAVLYLVVTSLMGALALSLERGSKVVVFLTMGVVLAACIALLHMAPRTRGATGV